MQSSCDLNDQLQDLTDHLNEFTGATAAYVGKLTKPIKGVSGGMAEEATDEDHLLPKAKEEIQFIHASEKAAFMKGQVLHQGQGVTFDILEKGGKEGPDDMPKHILIPEVVREDRMHYY